MNQNKLKSYAQQARRDFIAAVSDRALLYGLTPGGIEPAVEQSDVVLIGDRAFSRDVAANRKRLEERVLRDGFEHTMDAMAYTWFNRFAAIRYMELHGYLDHGYRVLSHPEGGQQPEILEHAAAIDLPGLDRDRAVELKLDGTKDEELYRLLLQAQCNALHRAMPFLFESIGGETELLLPANLLHTDSLIERLVEGVDEADWDEIEIVGWLYQFYISEKKDEVIGKVVKSEDIPAATQLFTPNWIVKCMVQNSLGAQWLATYPTSSLKERMEYYIEPAEQSEEVKRQLEAATPEVLDPEELTLLDPACGSGHILVEAYDLFKAIYLERGYRQRDVPKLILEKNLFGLDIDARAAQLAGFALVMKGRADDQRLFDREVKLNVMALVNSTGFNAERLQERVRLTDYGLRAGDLKALKRLFENATTLGSLIKVPKEVTLKLPALKRLTRATNQDLFTMEEIERLAPLVTQGEILSAQYEVVVANPPYMGHKFYCSALKDFVSACYKAGKADLYGAFTLRNIQLAKARGHIGMITIPNWMFLSSFERLRKTISRDAPILSLVHNGRGVWGSDFGSCSYTLQRSAPNTLSGCFLRLFDKQGSVASNEELKRRFHEHPRFSVSNAVFKKIPGGPVAYWISAPFRRAFSDGTALGLHTNVKHGLSTGKNDAVVRRWTEVSTRDIGFGHGSSEEALASARKWFPYNKGGAFRKWYGNCDFVLRYDEYGNALMRSFSGHRHDGKSHYFREGVTWTFLSSSSFAARYAPPGFVFDVAGSSLFCSEPKSIVAFLCSELCFQFLRALNPTLAFQVGNLKSLPIITEALTKHDGRIQSLAEAACVTAREDWDSYERSWDFMRPPIIGVSPEDNSNLESSYAAWVARNRDTAAEMKGLEEENNRLFIDAYGLQDELDPEVAIENITLTVNAAYRYGGKLTEEEQWTRFRQDTMQELVSYAIGCMMGRYSLDEAGLIYAHGGNADFDSSRYASFPADDDGIIPVTAGQWFDDDAARRLIEFISKAWDARRLEDNLCFLAANLSPRKNDTSRDTIRRYLCDRFFKDHLQTYKNRPIYWLVSSGKAKAFQCLVYLHRYDEGTLARMRTEYAVPLQGMMAARVRRLNGDIAAVASTAHRKRVEKERSTLVKQEAELRTFDEKLRHYADQRISLDLDDGVKVNYGKFGDLLAEVKKVTGRKAK